LLGFLILYNFKWSLYTVKINNISADNISQENY
jgi:hypothetical protein